MKVIFIGAVHINKIIIIKKKTTTKAVQNLIFYVLKIENLKTAIGNKI